MKDYQREFLDDALNLNIIRFGKFKLKSGRISPYFFNAGFFDTGAKLARLAKYYAAAAMDSGIKFDMLFGPAYKGIPLVVSMALTLAKDYNLDLPYAFDRKETKDHGEGGVTVGAPLKGNVLIIDDVISSGLSINHALELIRNQGATPSAILIALDRQEQGADDRSATRELESDLGLKIISIANLDTLASYLKQRGNFENELKAIDQYREQYGS